MKKFIALAVLAMFSTAAVAADCISIAGTLYESDCYDKATDHCNVNMDKMEELYLDIITTTLTASRYNITLTGTNGTITNTSPGASNLTARCGVTEINITAVPSANYYFIDWTVGSAIYPTSEDAIAGINALTGDDLKAINLQGFIKEATTFTANNAELQTLTVTATNGSVTFEHKRDINVIASGTYSTPIANLQQGDVVILTPHPTATHCFSAWSSHANGTISSGVMTITVPASDIAGAFATYNAKVDVTVTLPVNGTITATVGGDDKNITTDLQGLCPSGINIVLTAAADAGYHFRV